MIKASRNPLQFDAAETIVLRDIAGGAETSTATERGISIPPIHIPYWGAPTDVDGEIFEINFTVDSINTDGGTVALSVLVANRSDMPNADVVANIPITSPGAYRVGLDTKIGGSKYISVRATLSGGGGAERISYGAVLTRKL